MSLHPPREGSRATGEGVIISKYPDVCRSPTAPVPYTIVAYQSDDANTASSVFMTGQRAHKQNSIVTRCTGDEPGTGLGVKSNTVSSICHRKEHSRTVRIEGQWATRHDDEWWMNNRNTVGKLVWPKHNLSFSPTPPIEYAAVTGSGTGAATGSGPVRLAFANTGSMSDAAPIGMGGNNAGGQNRLAFLDTGQSGTQTAPQTQSRPTPTRRPPPPPPPTGSRWWKILRWSRRGNPYLNALELFFQQNPAYFADMPVFTDAERQIIREAQRAIDNGSDPQEVRRWARQQVDAERRRVEEETHAPPVPNARTEGNVTIKGRRRRRRNCRLRKYSEGCADAMPYSTPHHVVPDRAFREPGSKKLYNPGLSHGDGYTICVDGGTPRFSGANANEHGMIHAIYDARERALGQAGSPPGTAPLQELEVAGVQAASQVTGCSAVVMLQQLQGYHRRQGLRGDMRFRATKTAPWPSPVQIGNGSGTNGL
ncbi:DUF4150 domain-containing protein [Rhizobium deserti]|uniref:DUF4150 domain-containing protein n=1 Tax=Rhizobium deserti TaxID=2547961 RepID=A0A4R5U6G2_9HYPH|nr:DUF4150 domain-containing protein [Rhizobium deserti]TDK29363.1 DUF4150 domain-containing protein [Rhizobium deserti]